jgi:membrane protein DedA with SNARE-associated domain
MSISDIIRWAESLIQSLGEIGVALVIIIETVIPPIPSELLLPLAGSLVAKGEFNFFSIVLAATIGSVTGATVLYSIARWAGDQRVDRWIDRWGKWVLVSREDMDQARAYFGKKGNRAVLIGRVIPGIRSVISIPAGLTGMPVTDFLIYTTIGSAIWNLLLVSAGFFLGQQYDLVEKWLDPISPIIYALVIVAVLGFIGKRLWGRYGRSKSEIPQP